jgi:uncharacterized oligopeptide transporter (OPT) family protein
MTRKVFVVLIALALLFAVAIPVLTAQHAVDSADAQDAITRIYELDGQMMVADPQCPPPTGGGTGCG